MARLSTPLTWLALVTVTASAQAGDSEASRFPYDPGCAWGRLSDGRGVLVRCLSREEAQGLSRSTPAAHPAASAPTANPGGPAPAASGAPSAAASGSSAPTDAPTLSAELVEVKAEKGELPLARRKLGHPLAQYAQCVKDHGGLLANTAEVTVSFLVRERGRAEGASAEKFKGMTAEAAQCIAKIVDRRPVGKPADNSVPAAALIRITAKRREPSR